MPGPFRVEPDDDGAYLVVDAKGEQLADIFNGDRGTCEQLALALAGVLNSAEAGQALDLTLANLAAGRAA